MTLDIIRERGPANQFRGLNTLPPMKANVSAAIMLLKEIKVATRPTVQWGRPPRRMGHETPIPAKYEVLNIRSLMKGKNKIPWRNYETEQNVKKNRAQNSMLRPFNKNIRELEHPLHYFQSLTLKRSQSTHHKEDWNKLNGFKIF